MNKYQYDYIEVNVANNPVWTLRQWNEYINELIAKYGNETEMFIDCGHNIELVVKKKYRPRS